MKYAIIKDGVVIQVQLNNKYNTSEHEIIVQCDNSVHAGFTYDGETFSVPQRTEEEIANIESFKQKTELEQMFKSIASPIEREMAMFNALKTLFIATQTQPTPEMEALATAFEDIINNK